jgi:trans-aconitate methyltransferase
VADLGTGTGNLAARLLEVHRSARVVCYDHVAEMLARAQEKLGPTGRAQFRQSDLRRAGLVVARFDAVMSGFFLHHLTDRRKAEFFRHVFNRLPPGGWFWNGDQVALGSAFLQERADARQQAATRDAVTTGDITSDDLALRDEFGRSARSAGLERHYYAPLADLLEWLRFAGFDPVDVAWLEGDRAVFGGRRPE